MRIPTYNPQTRPSRQALVGPSGAGATDEAFGAGIARGLGNVAQGVGMLANFVTEQDRAVRRTKALRDFSAFQTRVNDHLTTRGQEHDPTVGNFSDIARAEYANMEAEFLNSIDPEFRDEFSVRTGEMGTGIASKSLAFQIESNDKWFRDQLGQELEASRVALGQNATPENFDMQLAKMEEMLTSSGLSPAEQEAQLHNFRRSLGAILYKQEQARRIAEEDETEAATTAAGLLIGAFTGADEEEQSVLAREGEEIAFNAIGNADMWAALPTRARAALASLASDLGELPQEVLDAIGSGDLENISAAIRELGGDRRTQEADLVLDPGAQIDDDPRFDFVPYEDRLALLEDAKAQALAEKKAADAATAAANAAAINALKVDLFDGNAGLMEIDTLRDLGVLTKYEDIKEAYNIYETRNEGLRMALRGQEMIDQGIEFNPNSDEDKKTLNAMIGKEGIKALQSRNGDYAASVLVPLVRESRMIPEEALGTLLGMMRSNEQDDALWALDALSQLDQASPWAYQRQVSDDVASAVELWRTRKDLYPPDQLMSLINGGLDQTERQQNKVLRDEAQSLLKDDKLNIRLNIGTDFQTGHWGQNATPASLPWAAKALESDFNRVFEDQYTLYGDVNQAKTAAIKILNRTWGATQVGQNGKVMKYPPEKFYPAVGGNYDWMERQLRETVTYPSVEDARNGTNPVKLLQDDEGFELIGDAQTESEVDAMRRGGPPVSYVVVRIKDGQPSTIPDASGMPMRFYFDQGPLERADEERWREEQANQFTQEDLQRALGLSQSHSLDTGIPIPPDSEGMGLAEYMMSQDPELTQEREQQVRDLLLGDPNDQVGIATGNYRLP